MLSDQDLDYLAGELADFTISTVSKEDVAALIAQARLAVAPVSPPDVPAVWGLYSDKNKAWLRCLPLECEEHAQWAPPGYRPIKLVPAGSEVSPAWHPKPTCPGWWTEMRDRRSYRIRKEDIDGATTAQWFVDCGPWYGPIPDIEAKGG